LFFRSKQSLRPSGLKQSLRPSGLKQSLRPSGLKQSLRPSGLKQSLRSSSFDKLRIADLKIFPLSRFIIHERSMLPIFQPGDHVLTFNWIKFKAGNVIVFKKGHKFYLKKIDKIVGKALYVSGDNKKESTKPESVKSSQVIGRVLLKY